MVEAQTVQATDPAAAGKDWGLVNRAVVNRAPWVSLPTTEEICFVSKRTGDVQVSPQLTLLLGQVWIR